MDVTLGARKRFHFSELFSLSTMDRQKSCFRFTLALLLSLIAFGSQSRSVLAQGNVRIVHTQEKEARGEAPYLGRDIWFAIPQNADPNDHSQKYFQVYVTSPRNTVVNFQVGGGVIIKKPVTAGAVTIFKSPTPKSPGGDITLSTEITTSGVVENKGVHVWSNDADIAVYFLSRVPYTSDGMYVLPSTGWGKEYVVGAYASLVVSQVDYPSEFVVIANQDNTVITVNPNWDIRKDGFPSVIEHKKGVPFTQVLNKGECVQYQVTAAQTDEWDVTGTVITANNPVGVIGASVCPFISSSDPYCDYILDMLQPARTWSNSYYSCPFAGRKYGGDAFLVVATKDGQVIKRNNAQVAILNKYQFYFAYDIDQASIWTSDTSFMMVQYVCSATHGVPAGKQRNIGDPAMVVINPADQFSRKVIFQTPTIDLASGQNNFTNYVNILLPANHENKTTYDGKLISAGGLKNVKLMERFPIPGTTWEAIRLTYSPGQGEGTHNIVSDTGVGVYIYGYGVDDSYAWAGALGTKTPNSPDTIPPIVIADGPCFCAHVKMSDTGPGQSKLSSYLYDSVYNMAFYPDPNFQPGAQQDSSFYDICVIDSSLEAFISVSIYDVAGNRTTVTSIYKPQFVKFAPSPLNFGGGNVGVQTFKYDTIWNTGLNPFNFKSANFKLSNKLIGFTIDSLGADGIIPVGGFRIVKIGFKPIVGSTVRDTMSIADECITIPCQIVGNGGTPDFEITSYTFDCTPLNAGRPTVNYFVHNPSGIQIQIDSVWLDDNINFGYSLTAPAGNVLPFIVPPSNVLNGQHEIIVTFSPQVNGPMKTAIHVKAKGGAIKIDTIYGKGCSPNIVTSVLNGVSDCGASYAFKVPFQNTGEYRDSIITVKGKSDSSGFSAVKIEDPLGNPLTTPFSLDPTKVVYVTVLYTPPSTTLTGCVTDTITITRFGGAVAAKTTVVVCIKNRIATVEKNNVDYGSLTYGGVPARDFFEVCNRGNDVMHISDVQSLAAAGSTAFKLANIYKVGAATRNLPIDLAPDECLDVYVDFDPAKFNITNQTDSFAILTNACNGNQQANLLAQVITGPPQIQGFVDAPILSCDVRSDSVTLRNDNPVPESITGIKITGANAANFSSLATVPVNVPAKSTVRVPILFSPSASAGQTIYKANVSLVVDNLAGRVDTLVAPIQATGQGVDLTITSRFTTAVATAGSLVTLPIQLAINKNGLNFPLAQLDIRRIELTYAYDQNILDIILNDIVNAVKLNNSAWTVDLATSKIDQAANTLQLNIVGSTALTDVDLAQPIGTIAFKASIPKTGNSTSVRLMTSKFLNSSASPVGNCMTIARVDSTFNLVYQCGDSTLQRYLNGENVAMRAYPVSPNPVGGASGNAITFRYASRYEGNITLKVFDELGKEVARIIDDMRLPAGTFEVHYNASGLSGGTYVYRFALDNRDVSSGRFVIQR